MVLPHICTENCHMSKSSTNFKQNCLIFFHSIEDLPPQQNPVSCSYARRPENNLANGKIKNVLTLYKEVLITHYDETSGLN